MLERKIVQWLLFIISLALAPAFYAKFKTADGTLN